MDVTGIITSNIDALCAVEGYYIMGAIMPAISAEPFTIGGSVNPSSK